MQAIYSLTKDKISQIEQHKRTPLLYAFTGNVMYVTLGFLVQKLHAIPAAQILFFRCLISMVFNTTLIKTGNHNIYPSDPRIFRLLMMRCIFGGIGHVLYYQALSMLNLSDAVTIFLASPIWSIILSKIFLNHDLLRSTIISIIVSFLGILLVVKPPILIEFFGFNNILDITYSPLYFIGISTAFAFSFLDSLSAILISSISKSVPVTAVLQYVYFSGFAFNGILMIISGDFNEDIYKYENFILVFLVALFNYTGQIFCSRALQLGKPTEVQPIQYTGVVMSYMVDAIILQKGISLLSIIGSGLILTGNFIIILNKKK